MTATNGANLSLSFTGKLADGFIRLAVDGGAPGILAGVGHAHGLTYSLVLNEFLADETGYVRPLTYYCDAGARNRRIAAVRNSGRSEGTAEMIVQELYRFLMAEIINDAEIGRAEAADGPIYLLTKPPAGCKPDRIGKWRSNEDINRQGVFGG